MAPKLPFKARTFLSYTKYAGVQLASVTEGVTEYDVNITNGVWTSMKADVVPQVMLNWLTSYGIEPLPGQTTFRTGFRVLFGAPAPAGAKISYSMYVTE